VSYYLYPVIVLGAVVVLGLVLIFLGRFRGGRYLKPIIMGLSKIPWFKRMFEKASRAAIERQSPDLASAIRKLQRVGPNPDERKLQQAYQSLSVAERRAYQEFTEQQGVTVEATNRQMRRMQERMTQANRPRGGGSSSRRKRK
jgi:hypothetical protein